MAQQTYQPAAQDLNISKETRAFLQALNSSGGKPLETLSPIEARSVLVGAQERFLTTPAMKWMWDNYLPDVAARKNKYASPYQASLEELKGLPRALVQIAENDILHDEGLAYGRKLDEAGVPTTIAEYKGLIHDYGLLNPLAHIPAVREAVADAAIALKSALFTR